MKNPLVDLVIGWVLGWLDRWLPGRRSEPAEHLPDGHPDAAPPMKHGKYSPVDTRPGRWNRAEGRFNPPAGKN